MVSTIVTLKAQNYVLRIKNTKKRNFATEYLNWRLSKRTHEPSAKGLTCMGSQSARLAIDDILNGDTK